VVCESDTAEHLEVGADQGRPMHSVARTIARTCPRRRQSRRVRSGATAPQLFPGRALRWGEQSTGSRSRPGGRSRRRDHAVEQCRSCPGTTWPPPRFPPIPSSAGCDPQEQLVAVLYPKRANALQPSRDVEPRDRHVEHPADGNGPLDDLTTCPRRSRCSSRSESCPLP